MQNNELVKKVAFLESQNDHLETELTNLNNMLVACGFGKGISTLKETMYSILMENSDPKASKNPNSIDLL